MSNNTASHSLNGKDVNEVDKIAIENFRAYLRIPSVHPNVDYEPCVAFFEKLAREIGLTYNIYRVHPLKPQLVLTWIGTNPKLPSIMLNSHMDVVPVFEEFWAHKPFGAEVDENGNIYGRGSQDAKSFGIQYLEAIRRLKLVGFDPKRTINVTFVTDEEIGGTLGTSAFVQTNEFKMLNVGFAIDEGGVSEDEFITVHHEEKIIWPITIKCIGQSGHGSLLLANTAGEKVQYLLNQFYKFRKKQRTIHKSRNTSVNLTVISGGVQTNVIPPEFNISIDTRVPVENFRDFEATVKKWCEEAGNGVSIENFVKDYASITKIDESNPFWVAVKDASDKMNIKLRVSIPPANTDARYLRMAGIPTMGFSPNIHTTNRIHSHNEYLSIKSFLNGIVIYEHIIRALSSV
ncbi:hypothetical protein FQA39_LY05793 [Lamprigera yunnana]|nr:hypothetical protein FQA39_LY05793 [Lamprigera yunnana]